MEDDIEEGAVHVQPAVVFVVFNEAGFAEFIQNESDAGPHGVNQVIRMS